MKNIFSLIGLWAISTMLQAQTPTVARGYVRAGDKGLGEVQVTDGFSFTVTDRDGNYSLALHEKAEFVYILTPKGYVADFSSGVPQFYIPVSASQKAYNFNLQAMKGDPDRFAMITMADTQIDKPSDIDRLMSETLPDIQATLEQYRDVQTAGIILGDITWDVYAYNDVMKDFCRRLGIPVYPVIGNHDFDKYLTPSPDADYAHLYKANYGPLYYAVQLGDVYYVVLNSLVYTGHKGYKTTLEDADQMHWLELLLNCVLQQDKQVIIATHCPIKSSPGSPLIGGGEQLVRMLARKFRGTVIAGHYHINAHVDLGGGIMEHILGAVCGELWLGNVANDGSPNGYQVFEGNKSALSWYYKATGFDRSVQMKVYPVGRVMDRPTAVVAKVWNWDEAWSVRWYQDGRFMGDMSPFYSYDPDYLAEMDGRLTVGDYVPQRTNHYFSAVPSEGAREIRIEVVDRFGQVYTETIEL